MPTWTQSEIETLRAAIASGVLTVTYDGPPRRSVTYQNLSEMRSLLASMEMAAGAERTIRYAKTSKGF